MKTFIMKEERSNMSKPKRKMVRVQMEFPRAYSLHNLADQLNAKEREIDDLDGEDAEIEFDSEDDAVYIQFTRPQTDKEYKETCRRSAIAKKAAAKRKANKLIGHKLLKE